MSIKPTLSIECHSFRKRQYDENDNDGQIQSPGNLLESIIFWWLLI